MYGDSLYNRNIYGHNAGITAATSADIRAAGQIEVDGEVRREVSSNIIAVGSVHAALAGAVTTSAVINAVGSLSASQTLTTNTSAVVGGISGLEAVARQHDVSPSAIRAGYNGVLYNRCLYGALPYRRGTELTYVVRARIVKPYVEPPPVMETLSYGLSRRFAWLQEGIQAFSLFNKITYATGQDGLITPSLDRHWGEIYGLPRLAGESDDDYRSRLSIYVKVLTGSGTIPNAQAVLDFLIGPPGGSRVNPVWPGRAIITFDTVEAMRQARAKESLINSVLPGMFAAGIDYEVLLPFLEYTQKALVAGNPALEYVARAAVSTDCELGYMVNALVGFQAELDMQVRAAVQCDRTINYKAKAVVMAERLLGVVQKGAIRGDAELSCTQRGAARTEILVEVVQKGAIMAERGLEYVQKGAMCRNFELTYKVSAFMALVGQAEMIQRAAVSGTPELTYAVRARVARP